VVKNILRKKIQAGRLIVTDKMHLMSSCGKRFTQFRGQNAASTKGGITHNTDVHANRTTMLVTRFQNPLKKSRMTASLRHGIFYRRVFHAKSPG
jgi:hypothetical protein